MRLRNAAFILLAAAPALAGVPGKGDGTITLLGGLRAIPGGDYQTESGNKRRIEHLNRGNAAGDGKLTGDP